YSSSWARYAGLMLTMIAPMRAVAYCTKTHSGQLTAQMPTRSPVVTPLASSPRATSSTAAPNSAYVQRRPEGTSTRASRSGQAATARARLAPMVSPSSGVVLVPWAYDRAVGSVVGDAVV